MSEFTWGAPAAPLHISCPDDEPARVSLSCSPSGPEPVRHGAIPGAAEVLAAGAGRALTTTRLDRTAIGRRLRCVGHHSHEAAGWQVLELQQRDELTGLSVTTTLRHVTGSPAYRAATTVRNDGADPITLQALGTITLTGLTGALGAPSQLRLATARNEWCAESRWSRVPLVGPENLADINAPIHGHTARGSRGCTSTSTWSSGEFVPVAVIEGDETGRALAWQIEHNGPWHWEINTQFTIEDWLSLVLSGPDDLHHSWAQPLAPGESFTSITASFALSADGLTGAIGELTRLRRASRIAPPADQDRPLIFNDYMNALMGDPTTEKLLPLIDAAAEAGARTFCIDAGWYDDGGDWWPSVGAWQPSQARFGELGLTGVLSYIRERGMRPGLWIEPEVIGVHSPMASELPEECFMHRLGERIVEHDRHFLDFRSPATHHHLDAVFDRLIGELGVRYFKWDYNVTPGAGPDTDTASPGSALLDHCRALLTWIEQLRARHPDVIVEACSSGAQRMDQATVSRYDLQSTSDQQDYRRYAAIAAAAPMALAPEQAGNWAYPQSEMTDEQIVFTLVTGLAGRLYLSGNVDQLGSRQRELVREAAAAYPDVIEHHARALPHWPLGLPGWDDPVVALGSRTEECSLLFVWQREQRGEVSLSLPHFAGLDLDVAQVFPTPATGELPSWPATWDAAGGVLHLDTSASQEAARVLRVSSRR